MMNMSPQAAVRAQARNALRHRYAPAVLGFVVLVLAFTVVDAFSSVPYYLFRSLFSDDSTRTLLTNAVMLPVGTACAILISPVINGFIRMFYRNALNDRMEPADLYHYFAKNLYARTLRLNLGFVLRMILPCLLFFLPVFGYVAVCMNFASSFFGSVPYSDFFFILCILSMILVVLYSLRYFVVFTLYAENDRLSNRELFRISALLMRTHSASAAKLVFSYTPWLLLCMTILPMIYVVPYMTQGLCIGAKWMSRTYNDWTKVPPELREVMYESITMHDRV